MLRRDWTWRDLPRLARRAVEELGLWLHRLYLGFGPRRTARKERLRRALSDADSVLFVCKGNICRSAFAERYASTFLPDSVRVGSAGHSAGRDGRSPDAAVKVARSYGVSLEEHRSVPLDERAVREFDVILLFDQTNFRTLKRSYPTARDKMYLLGLLNDDGPLLIEDPFGREEDRFRTIFGRIRSSLSALEAPTGARQLA